MARLPLLLGHRGMRGSSEAKENTLEAFDHALQQGCDGFEFDVRLTGDGRAVICHDPKIDGVTLSRAVASQLTHLPLLEQVLQRFHRTAFLDIELKVAGLESSVASALAKFPPERGYVISSFLPQVVQALDSKFLRGIICETRSQLQSCRSLKVEYLIAQSKLVSEQLVRKVHDAEANILVWTVNDAKRMGQLAEWGVDGIISDDPRLLASTIGRTIMPGPFMNSL
jgi:glycerophosphoryl diester phosphodiesterase